MFLSHESLLADIVKFVEVYFLLESHEQTRLCSLGKSCFAPLD